MNYLDVYFSRINHFGDTTAERIRNTGVRSFEKWLAESPHTLRNLSVERGLYFDGIILTSKDKEYEKIMFLEVANDIPLKVGDIMNWPLEDGNIEKWLLIQEEKKVNGTFKSFWIIRCNYLLKWIDSEGHLQKSWGYFVSSLDSKIKGNFRTWNSLITPQPNKYAEILMPRYPVDRATNFILEEEAWTVIEYDHTSVPGIIYLSLTEDKINKIYDDTINDIADLDKLAKYDILAPEEKQVFKIGEPINIQFTLTKNGIPIDEEIEYSSLNEDIARIDRTTGQLMAIKEGTADIIITLKKYPTIQRHIAIEIADENQTFAYLEGNSAIKLDRVSEYVLKGIDDGDVIFTIDNQELVIIVSQEKNKCVLRANAKNRLGAITLTAEYANKIYKKEISIIPLW